MRTAEYRIAIETRYNGNVWYIPQVRFTRHFPFGIKINTKWYNIYKCPHGGYEHDKSFEVAHQFENDALVSIRGYMEYRAKHLGKFTKNTEYKYIPSGL